MLVRSLKGGEGIYTIEWTEDTRKADGGVYMVEVSHVHDVQGVTAAID